MNAKKNSASPNLNEPVGIEGGNAEVRSFRDLDFNEHNKPRHDEGLSRTRSNWKFFENPEKPKKFSSSCENRRVVLERLCFYIECATPPCVKQNEKLRHEGDAEVCAVDYRRSAGNSFRVLTKSEMNQPCVNFISPSEPCYKKIAAE